MSGKNSSGLTRRGPAVQVVEDSTLERLTARAVSKVGVLVPPWVLLVVLVGAGGVTHHLWGTGPDPGTGRGAGPGAGLAWVTAGTTAGSLVLAWLTWTVSHDRRSVVGRVHNVATALLAGSWVTAATITGPTHPVTGSVAVLGGVTLALTWNVRTVVRGGDGSESGHRDTLATLFGAGADAAGLGGASARTTTIGAHKVVGALALDPGVQTSGDAIKRVERIESAMALPPGSVSVSTDLDRADHAHITISDPRVMRAPLPWPGPSRPGASISEPITPGVWQDLDSVEYVIPGHHLQIMGMTGSGKSIGGGWNILAEIITRCDVHVLAVDVTKGTQTLGPLAPALHALETTPTGAKALITSVQGAVRARTDHLAARGLSKWAPGCGLSLWVLWIEEAPDVFDALGTDGTESILKLLKGARSAGITCVLSLQRADWTQMPTIARGQLAKMCFGVADSSDAAFGLTEAQADAGARPEAWADNQPGMAYLSAPGISEHRRAMALRTWSWGNDHDGATAMTTHANNWPAHTKTADPYGITTPPDPHHGGPQGGGGDLPDDHDGVDDEGPEEDLGDPIGEHTRTPVPEDVGGVLHGITDPITDPTTEWAFTPAPDHEPPMTTPAARAALRTQITTWAHQGRAHFGSRDLRDLLALVGRKRQWAQAQYVALAADGLIGEYDETLGGYPIHPPTTTGNDRHHGDDGQPDGHHQSSDTGAGSSDHDGHHQSSDTGAGSSDHDSDDQGSAGDDGQEVGQDPAAA